MNKEQFIYTLQACYFGDKGAYNLILKEYEELHNKIDNAINYIKNKQVIDLDYLEKILKDSDVDE